LPSKVSTQTTPWHNAGQDNAVFERFYAETMDPRRAQIGTIHKRIWPTSGGSRPERQSRRETNCGKIIGMTTTSRKSSACS
jgi:hypothetical protein